MDGAAESNNNSKVLRRGLENEDSSFSSARSSLRARRDRLARREALQTKDNAITSPSSPSVDVSLVVPLTTVMPNTTTTCSPRNSVTKRSRLANEYSQPVIDSNDDETALSLLASSNILSMDDSTIRSSRGLSAVSSATDLSRVSQQSVTPTGSMDPKVSTPTNEGESGAMNSMRKSLPANMRSRRTRKELQVEDMRTRTPSRELINNDINGLTDPVISNVKSESSPMVNGTMPTSLTNGTASQHNGNRRRKSFLDETSSTAPSPAVVVDDSRLRSYSELTCGDTDIEKPSIERTTSGSTNMSAGAVIGETREERIARYKEMRKAALAARTTQYIDSGTEDNTTPAAVSGYVPRYLRNRDNSGASVDRNRDDDAGSGYVPRWRRGYNKDDNDMASSSNASSMTDLHITRKDSSASSDNSTDNGTCKLTYENLKLHDKLSSAAPPYSSLSRLEESPTIAPISIGEVNGTQSTTGDTKDYNKHSHRKESTNDDTPTNSPALTNRASSRINNRNSTHESFNFDNKADPLFDRRSKRPTAEKDLEVGGATAKDNQISLQAGTRETPEASSKSTTINDKGRGLELTKAKTTSKAPSSVSDTSDMAQQMDTPPVRRGSVGLSDRLKKFEASAETTPSSAPSKLVMSKPKKLDISKFSRQSSTEESKIVSKPSPAISYNDVTDSVTSEQVETTQKLPENIPSKVSNTDNAATERIVRRPNPLLNMSEPRPSSSATDEPLLDPQLAAMLEARKIKAGESPVADVTSILKSRMKKREELDGKKSTISVSARASFFKDEQKRVAESPVNKAVLDRHPSAKIPQVDKQDVEMKRAIGVKKAMLLKKRQRSATQPITVHELFAIKTSSDRKHDKTQDDFELLAHRPYRGRLLSVPTTNIEIREVKYGSAPQKYIRPKEKKQKDVKKDERKISQTSRPGSVRKVSAKVDSGRSVLTRNTTTRSSVRTSRTVKAEPSDPKASSTSSNKGSVSSLIDAQSSDQPNRFSRRSASVRVSGSTANSVKAAAERAHALVVSRRAATSSIKRVTSKVGDSIRAKATAKVDSRRSVTNAPQMNVNSKKLSVNTSETKASSAESCPLSPTSTDTTTSTADRVTDSLRTRKLSASTANSEDIPNYMRMTTAAHNKDRHTPANSIADGEDLAPPPQSKRRSGSLRELDVGQQPSYMKPTNSFAHRLEAKLEDLTPLVDKDAVDIRPKSKPISLLEQERGEAPSFMRPTASSTKRLERVDIEDDRPRPKRAVSPSLPDGDLPSYMKATESYFKKVEHLFDDEIEEPAKPTKKTSVTKSCYENEVPSFMKPTKAFEALVAVPVEESIPEHKQKRRSIVVESVDGELPSYMKPTKSFDKHKEGDCDDTLSADKRHRSSSVAKLSVKSSSTTHSENGDIPSFVKTTKSHEIKGISKDSAEPGVEHHAERRKSAQASLLNGEVPSFMKPTKSFEIRDRHNEEAMLQHEQQPEPERKVSSTKKHRVSIPDGELPSYMKTTKSYDIREHAIATGAPEMSSLELALQRPMIDQVPELTSATSKTSRKSSVGSFLKKKFGLGKGTSVDSVSSSNTAASKTSKKLSSSTKPSNLSSTTAAKAAAAGSAGAAVPSYMKPTSNSSHRKISESLTDEGDTAMSAATLSSSSLSGREGQTPMINVTQVSFDGEDHTVPMRPKRAPAKLKNTEEIDSNSNNTPKSSIANRSASVRVRGTKAQSLLASLQVNGEEGWKRRIGEKDHGSFRSGSIHDRLSKIEDNSKGWQKKKGQENDAKQFTVEGKMAKKGEVKVAPSPLMPRKEKTVGAAKRAGSFRLKREEDKLTPSKTARPLSMQIPKRDVVEVKQTVTVVQVPDIDDAAEFFAPSSTQENIEVTSADFDHIFVESSNLLPSISKIKPKRNRASNSPNPYKALQMRQDIKSEYTETRSDIADREMKRVNKAKVAEKASRTALAGLATKEDINRISLKKANHSQVMNPGGMSAAPYNDLMLIQIKGRRHVEMRIVRPCGKSINSGDCFLLLTKNKIFQWVGEFANVMERSKAADLATYIVTKKDLGCTLAKSVTVIDESKQVGPQGTEFWKLLGGNASYSGSGPMEEDELYEDYMAETNLVYRVNGDELSPIDDYCAQIPRYDMLDDEQVLVFDFGTEVYSWCGKLASMEQRKMGLKLAKMLYQSGYDYTECDINPMSPLTLPDKGGLPKKSDKRPEWAICGKITANMETLLFKEKFYDWPEASRLIQTKDARSETLTTSAEELKAFDAKIMLEKSDNPVTIVLEASNVGRGDHWVEYEDGLKREYEVDTLGLRMWHVSSSEYYELMEDSYGQLHSGDTYVVRWQYQVKQSGVRNLKGNLSKHQAQLGRERCAYFFWQGAQSTINEKGASALMTVELDEENGPQVRVEQGLEPACFLSLFNGHLITHLGKRDDDEKKNSTKLYVVEHEHEKESSLHEVPCRIDSLRSRGVFVYINIRTGLLYLWFGSHASANMKKNGRKIASWISEQCPMEIGLSLESTVKIVEIKEGSESMEFLTALRSNNRNKYDCLLNTHSLNEDYVPRLFHMTSVNLTFHVQEIFLPARNEQYSAFPFLQSQLYKQHQPAIHLLDFGEDVYLWQGWWPLGSEEAENVSTGSARSRYTGDRKLALETSINYCKARKGKTPNMYCVYAGKEPLSFTNHFPEWEVSEEAATANTLENRPSTLEDMHLCFQRLSKSVYTFEELQQRPLPDGVNPNKLETYLSNEQFHEVLTMSREEFAALPGWKQTNIRKESELF